MVRNFPSLLVRTVCWGFLEEGFYLKFKCRIFYIFNFFVEWTSSQDSSDFFDRDKISSDFFYRSTLKWRLFSGSNFLGSISGLVRENAGLCGAKKMATKNEGAHERETSTQERWSWDEEKESPIDVLSAKFRTLHLGHQKAIKFRRFSVPLRQAGKGRNLSKTKTVISYKDTQGHPRSKESKVETVAGPMDKT